MSWPYVRSLLREAMIATPGAASQPFDISPGHSRSGLDRDRLLTLCDAQQAIQRLTPVQRSLIECDIGYHCVKSKRCPRVLAGWAPGHWHRKSWQNIPGDADEKRELLRQAIEFVERATFCIA